MDQNLWHYLVMGFLSAIVVVQWFTNKWALEERDWLKQKIYSMMPNGNRIVTYSRLSDEYRQSQRRRR